MQEIIGIFKRNDGYSREKAIAEIRPQIDEIDTSPLAAQLLNSTAGNVPNYFRRIFTVKSVKTVVEYEEI